TCALGKAGTALAVIMPERVAKTDPYKLIDDYVGSGPMRFVAAEQISGARAVFERFKDYVPRQEPASWLAGGKQMLIDRLEGIVQPHPGPAPGAPQNSGVSGGEQPRSRARPPSSPIER